MCVSPVVGEEQEGDAGEGHQHPLVVPDGVRYTRHHDVPNHVPERRHHGEPDAVPRVHDLHVCVGGREAWGHAYTRTHAHAHRFVP